MSIQASLNNKILKQYKDKYVKINKCLAQQKYVVNVKWKTH
jgi:hypothetical protein